MFGVEAINQTVVIFAESQRWDDDDLPSEKRLQFNRAFFKFDSLDPILGFLHQWDETLYSSPVGRETTGGALRVHASKQSKLDYLSTKREVYN